MVDKVALKAAKFDAKLRRRRAVVMAITADFPLVKWKSKIDAFRDEVIAERQQYLDDAETEFKAAGKSDSEIKDELEVVQHHLGMNEFGENKSQLDSDFARDLWFPLTAGLLLNRNAQFAAADEWYRLLYDPVTGKAAEIFDNFTNDALKERTGTSWLRATFDPIAIANRRSGVWLRYTIIAMVRNLIDWADDDFARGLPDTIPRAEERYELAKKVLGAHALDNECETIVLDVIQRIGSTFGMTKQEAIRYAAPLMQLRSVAAMKQAAKNIDAALNSKDTKETRRAAVKQIIEEARDLEKKERPHKSLKEDWDSRFKRSKEAENKKFSQLKSNKSISPDLKPKPDRDQRLDDLLGGAIPPQSPPSIISLEFCIPLNPVVNLLKRQIANQLNKLNLCLDITGEPQIPRVYDCDTYDPATGVINRPTAMLSRVNNVVDQPRYRYSYLVEKARQYVDVAQRIGSLLLQALQARDSEAYAQLKAAHAIDVTGATVELRRLGQIEASRGVEMAELQSDRADSQVQFWGHRAGNDVKSIWDSLSESEAAGLALSGLATALSSAAVLPAAGVAAAGAGISAAGFAATATGVGATIGIPAILIGATVAGVASVAALLSGGAGAASSASNTALTYASFERRFEDWKNQFNLAQFDSRIAALQVTLANDREAIADQETVIAQLQLSQAREELRFLQNKNSNAALYDWMIRVLSRDYRSLMQVAAGVAHMAQRSLEFERQEPVRIILGDYWNVTTDVIEARRLTETQRSLGLLGAERLLTDLTKLDAFRLTTERRRQQLSKTISLARMMPIDLVNFRDSGTITFNTLMEWFDDDFQGQYLRLIKSVRVTVLALGPPIDGIHATLQNTGESSVVVSEDGGLTFSKKRALRNFGERISLDSPFNETGLFVLNYEDPMLLPFEGLGVETQWTFELPRANNCFNFDSIADVYLTIDYTAEHSSAHEREMRASRMVVDVQEDTAIPLRLQFPDDWYHLKNHRKDQAARNFLPFAFKFHMPRNAFAPNLSSVINVVHLTLLVSGKLTDADQDLVADCISISHQGTVLHKGKLPRPASAGNGAIAGDPTSAFGNPVLGTNSLLLSTYGQSASGLKINPQIEVGTPDEWSIEFSSEIFPDIIRNISDVLLVITVQGKRG